MRYRRRDTHQLEFPESLMQFFREIDRDNQTGKHGILISIHILGQKKHQTKLMNKTGWKCAACGWSLRRTQFAPNGRSSRLIPPFLTFSCSYVHYLHDNCYQRCTKYGERGKGGRKREKEKRLVRATLSRRTKQNHTPRVVEQDIQIQTYRDPKHPYRRIYRHTYRYVEIDWF